MNICEFQSVTTTGYRMRKHEPDPLVPHTHKTDCPYVFNYLVILEYSLHRWRQKKASESRSRRKVHPAPGAEDPEEKRGR